MLLRVLGTAAGGGIPQWNCACPICTGARAHPARRRRHASLAVQAADDRWYVVNATPDIGDQIEDCPPLLPRPGTRQTPVAGIILTDAELDHTLGIARLREADIFEVLATAAVRDALRTRLHLGTTLAPYAEVRWRDLPHTGPIALGPEPWPEPGQPTARPAVRPEAVPTAAPTGKPLVEVSAIPVSGKRPRYAAADGGQGPGAGGPHAAPGETARPGSADPGHDGAGWSVALRITDRASGATALYAPAVATWSAALADAAAEADCLIVDGTFWDDEEPIRTGIGPRTATGMGHLPIVGPGGTAERLAALRARCLYTHLNNTNPLVDPDAAEHRRLAEWGIEVAADGMVIEL
ncbi:pyrroloquinoline quinone biosynthesis protein PqqB [Streptomyces buecherae]|uniref:pyrroloquinoline quinone biosynthesis protein PqqB n=1 Tax=Streptomyces buecherae TaxID=2763006 RepID=UPI00164EB3AE|nr:MBL fold metallo-hydrolase [Streptomyces buecherae]QNJ39064.1 pyrroloquinoline quinone biosynthesis protein PqqB [Streptomyces buecherae]